jgi:hypothetical protein
MIGDIIEIERARHAMGDVADIPVRDTAGDRISSGEIGSPIDIRRFVDRVVAEIRSSWNGVEGIGLLPNRER